MTTFTYTNTEFIL